MRSKVVDGRYGLGQVESGQFDLVLAQEGGRVDDLPRLRRQSTSGGVAFQFKSVGGCSGMAAFALAVLFRLGSGPGRAG